MLKNHRLIAYPIGKLAAYALPIRTWNLPKRLGGKTVSLNPGPFNIKVRDAFDVVIEAVSPPYSSQEHVCIYMMANASIFPTYAMNTIVVLE